MRRAHSRRCKNDRRSGDRSHPPAVANDRASRLCVRTKRVHPRSTSDSSRSATVDRSRPAVDSREKAVNQLLTSFRLHASRSLTGEHEHVGRTNSIFATALADPPCCSLRRMRRIGDNQCQRTYRYQVRCLDHQQSVRGSGVWGKRQSCAEHGAGVCVVREFKGCMDNPESDEWSGRSDDRLHRPTQSERLATTRPCGGVGPDGRGQPGRSALPIRDFAVECRRSGRTR